MSPERRLRGRAEAAAWAALLAINLLTHFWCLGSRAMSHDESLHAFYSHELAAKGEYKHDPMMHGPLLFHASALAFLLLGESDTTARLYPALAGLALVAALYAFRRFLGRFGALMAALLLTLSPSVLFYGRYLTHDVMACLYSVVWVWGAFRYLESRRPRYLFAMTLGMALSFCTKETCFIFGATIGAYFAGLALARRWRRRETWGGSASGELALVMLTLALPFAAALGHLVLGWNPKDFDSPEGLRRSGTLISGFLVASGLLAVVGLRRGRNGLSLRTWMRAMALFWAITVVLYTTVFTSVSRGLVSGIVGSLGYWLAEHPNARGGQPWFYYLFLGSLYELLPLALGLAAIVSLLRGRFGFGRRGRFAAFLAWWALASLLAYSAAGEKMPWLLVHVVVPFCMLGGLQLGRLVSSIDWTRLAPGRAFLGLAAPGAAALLLGPLLWLQPFAGRDPEAVAASARWLFHLAAGVAVLVLAGRRLGPMGRERPRLLALGAVAFLALFTARSALMLSFVNEDLATEFLVYAHATPDVKRALAEIDEVAARTGRGAELEVAYDDDSAWPLTWYLRAYPRQRFYSDTPTAEAMSAPVVLVGKKNFERAEPFLAQDYVRRDYRLVWWPLEGYTGISFKEVLATLRDPKRRSDLLQIVLYRRYPGVSFAEWPYRHEFRLYLRRDLVAQVWPLGIAATEAASAAGLEVLPEVRCAPLAEYEGPYAGLRLSGPTAIAVAGDGGRLIADTGNHRVVVLEADGRLRLVFGSHCELARPGGGCVDPDGEGPSRLGDGQLQEPWGIASGAGGEILVADTWNGRIQVFDGNGRFLRAWGTLGLDQPPPIPTDRLYGPRGIAFDEGRRRVVVSDTGHKRLVVYSMEGQALLEAGAGGSAGGRFDEPAGIAVDPEDGSLYVADAWNRRIQRLGADLKFMSAWPVPGWGGKDVADKPYVAVDDRGYVFASVPRQARVLVFGPGGAPILSLSGSDWRGKTVARPTGLAVDVAAGTLLVADPGRDRIVALPLLRSPEERCR